MKLNVLNFFVYSFVISLFSLNAFAAGKLNLYNWADYTPDELIKKFETETGIQVIVDTYDSNETLLAKLQASGGSSGYDLAVPSQHFVDIMIKEGLLAKVSGIKELQEVKRHAIDLNLPWSEVSDAGHTQLEPGTTTCISIGPAPENLIDKITGNLKLL